jgi:hypothetical protein
MKFKPVIIVTGASRGLGAAIAWLALLAPADFGGKFLDYDDPLISRRSADLPGEHLH